jgi:Predicted membrane protein (DUF2157).
MSKLDKRLNQWVLLQFISDEQANKISAYETKRSTNSLTVLSSFLTLGAFIIGIGIISLVAANWQKIPDMLKLAVDFGLLAAVACLIFKIGQSGKIMLQDGLIFFYLILCLASIGLIAQIYHTSGPLYQLLLFWALITVAPMLIAKRAFIPFIWFGGLIGGLTSLVLDTFLFALIFDKSHQVLFMTIPLFCFVASVISRCSLKHPKLVGAIEVWVLITVLAALISNEVSHLWGKKLYASLSAYGPSYILLLLSAFVIWSDKNYSRLQKILLLLTFGVYLIPFHLRLLEVKNGIGYPLTYDLAYALLSSIILGLIATLAATLKKWFLFQAFLFLVGVRFLILYFQALGGLATTGIGLIIAGGLVIVMVFLWYKYQKRVLNWSQRMVNDAH